MSTDTKACNLTEDEIECVMAMHGRNLNICGAARISHDETMERLNYLNKRLKAFKEPEVPKQEAGTAQEQPKATTGWGTNNV